MGLFSKRKKHEAKEDPAQQAATIAKLESELTAAENNVRQLKPEVIKIQEEWQEVDASLINTNSQIASIGEVSPSSAGGSFRPGHRSRFLPFRSRI
jgi:uncharacterized protein YlxW (UPF0749 family)